MPEPLINIDDCLAEIPGDSPAGEKDAFYLIRDQLDEARKEVDPANYAEDDPTRPDELKPADWPKIVRAGTDALAHKCKHLEIAVRLTEALTRQHGFSGLADGLTLLRRMVGECWDRILPAIEEPGDEELRGGPFELIGLANSGFSFPATVRSVPLVTGKGGESYGWERVAGKKADRDGYDAAVKAVPVEKCQGNVDALSRALTELADLGKVLAGKLGSNTPGLHDLTSAVNDCYQLAKQVLKEKGPVDGGSNAGGGQPIDGNGEGSGAATGSTPSGNWDAAADRAEATRQDVYRELERAAALLEKLEPRSPVPYLVRRAVALGNLPFHELLKVLVRDANAVAEINREFGIDQAEAHGG